MQRYTLLNSSPEKKSSITLENESGVLAVEWGIPVYDSFPIAY